MNAATLKAHLDAIDAQLELARVQVQGLRHALAPLFAPKATLSLPARCEGFPDDRCALQDEDARVSRGTFVDPNAWQCIGCRHRDTFTPQAPPKPPAEANPNEPVRDFGFS